MQHRLIQSIGIAWTLLFATFIIWVYATEPRNIKEITAGVQSAAGVYDPNKPNFDAGLKLFREEKFRAARIEWELADGGRRDAPTQFYIAYAYYREGWRLVQPDKDLYQKGLERVNLALELSGDKPLKVEDPNLGFRSPAELKAELEKGLERGFFDPLSEGFSIRQ